MTADPTPTRTSSDRKADSGVARSRRVSLLLAAIVAALGLLWDHCLTSLVVPAACLAHRLWPPPTLFVREERSEPEPSAAGAPT